MPYSGSTFSARKSAISAYGSSSAVEGRLDEPQVAEAPARRRSFTSSSRPPPLAASGFEQRLEQAGAGLQRAAAEVARLDRLELAGDAGLALGVQDGGDERGEFEQASRRTPSSGPSTTAFAASATLANTGALAPACSSGGRSFLQPEVARATTLPATASRRASSYTWVRTAMLMGGLALRNLRPQRHRRPGLGTADNPGH